MKAVTFYQPGGPEVLRYEEMPEPAPGPGQALVRVHACSLNHLDLIVRGRGPAVGLPWPHITGADASGVVVALGPGTNGIEVGARVVLNPGLSCGQCSYCLAGEQSLCRSFGILGRDARGAMAEYVVVPARNLYPIPAGLTFYEAAAAPLVFMTAWRMLVTQAKVRAGERVLVIGAGGGVATATIQIAKLLGATVYTTTGGPEKVQRALETGADAALDYRTADVVAAITDLTSHDGVDVVVDSVGAATFESSLQCLGKAGRFVVCGATTGWLTQLDLRVLWRKQISLHGSTMANEREFRAVAELLATERLRPVVDQIFPLAAAQAAETYLESGVQFGKVVFEVP
jgi:NADPH:quinone reductase-like Zn-dependent oxidoreductase